MLYFHPCLEEDFGSSDTMGQLGVILHCIGEASQHSHGLIDVDPSRSCVQAATTDGRLTKHACLAEVVGRSASSQTVRFEVPIFGIKLRACGGQEFAKIEMMRVGPWLAARLAAKLKVTAKPLAGSF